MSHRVSSAQGVLRLCISKSLASGLLDVMPGCRGRERGAGMSAEDEVNGAKQCVDPTPKPSMYMWAKYSRGSMT